MRGFPARARGRGRMRSVRLALASAIGGVLLAPAALLAADDGSGADLQRSKAVRDAPPPAAALSVQPRHPTAAQPVSLDADGSSGTIVRFRWDLDGDGTFETAGGPRQVLIQGLPAGRHRLGVRVEDRIGRSDQATTELHVASAPEPPKPVDKARPRHRRQAAAHAPQPKVRAAGDPPVTIESFAFHPQTITIGAGDTVTWTNRDDAAHTATGNGGSFDTGMLQTGQSGSHTFASAGRFGYICAIHPSMTGTVVVTGDSSSGGGGSGGSSHSAGSGGGSSSGSASTSGTASGSATTGSGSLPHTGLELLAVVLVGMLLTASGVALRLLLDGAQALAGRRAGPRG